MSPPRGWGWRSSVGPRTSRVSEILERVRWAGGTALIPYLMGGYPSFDESIELVIALSGAGADVIEVGIPFSDPLADGPTIQMASQAALEGGLTPPRAIELVARVRKVSDVPIVFMTYYNIVLHYGLKAFARDAAEAGANGIILPDLPPDEAAPWQKAAKGRLDTIFLLAPTSTDAHIKQVAQVSQGFIYAVSTTGVTGARQELPPELSHFVAKIRAATTKPVAVGFGVSTPEQAQSVAQVADGVIIGSALIDVITAAKPGEAVDRAVDFIRPVRQALDAG